MLEAVPKRLFSTDYLLRSPDGDFAELDVSGWRERAEFELDGAAYRLYREGMVSGAFVLERDGVAAARAWKPSAFRSTFELDAGGRALTLRRASLFRRRFALLDGGREVGSVGPAGLFSRRVRVDLPAALPFALQIFVFWLVLLMWERYDNDAAEAS